MLNGGGRQLRRVKSNNYNPNAISQKHYRRDLRQVKPFFRYI